jgi:hypothetical protein
MSKNYTADKVNNLLLRIKFSTPSDPVFKENETTHEMEYFAAVQHLQCVAKNGVMQAPVHVAEKYYGTAKSVPWTAKEVGDAMKDYNTLNTAMYNDLKAIWIAAINEDITV